MSERNTVDKKRDLTKAVEHLRLVNFSLTVTFISLLLASSLPGTRQLQQAYDNLIEIISLTDQGQWNSDWVKDYIEETAELKVVHSLGPDSVIKFFRHVVIQWSGFVM